MGLIFECFKHDCLLVNVHSKSTVKVGGQKVCLCWSFDYICSREFANFYFVKAALHLIRINEMKCQPVEVLYMFGRCEILTPRENEKFVQLAF